MENIWNMNRESRNMRWKKVYVRILQTKLFHFSVSSYDALHTNKDDISFLPVFYLGCCYDSQKVFVPDLK